MSRGWFIGLALRGRAPQGEGRFGHASSPLFFVRPETSRSSSFRFPRKGNAERRAVQPRRGATCCGTHGSVHLREAHGGVWPCGSHGPARAPYRLERDGLGNRNTLRSAKRRFYQLATPSSASAGALTKCGHRRIAGSLGRPPSHAGTSLPEGALRPPVGARRVPEGRHPRRVRRTRSAP